jgi:Leucine-rich repeat (LRR) protein
MKKIALLTMTIVLATLLAGCAKAKEVDKTPPVISEISASDITQTGAVITWTTDEPATSQVEYGLTTGYGSTATSPLDALVTSHSISLSSLDENTTYHYRVKSKDASGNEAVSEDHTFTTSKVFPDASLEAAIRAAIGKAEGAIYPSDLEGLTSLDGRERGITNVTGLEYCINLAELYLYGNEISDITPLSNLTSLTTLNLFNNQISDITPLSNLTNLTGLYLMSNQVSNIGPLGNLTSLRWLYLGGNQISDITPLRHLTSLIDLALDWNQISNITPLGNLTNLTRLYLTGNQVSNIGPLGSLTSLTDLYLGSNQISDVSVLSGLTSLTKLYLGSNQITDITPLVENEGLSAGDTVDLRGNPLSSESLNTLIPQLEARGVIVNYDAP